MELSNPHFRLNLLLVSYNFRPATQMEFYLSHNGGSARDQEINKQGRIGRIFAEIYAYAVVSDALPKKITEVRGTSLLETESTVFYAATNDAAKHELMNAQSYYDRGIASGYPKDASRAFGRTIDGQRRNHRYVQNAIQSALVAGRDIPLWLAYISHIPEHLDLVNNRISSSSQRQGELYQNFTRDHDPNLAERVEAQFMNKYDMQQKAAAHSLIYKFNAQITFHLGLIV